MHLAVERSAATSAAILPMGTVWSQMQSGLGSFFSNPLNATVRSTLTLFPDSPTAPATVPDCNTTTCSTANCTPRAALNFANQASFQSAVLAASPAAGGPPTSAGYAGMINTATPYTSSASFMSDAHIAVLVLASDVANCNPSVAAMATAAATTLATTRIRTFVIGIGVPATTTAAIATAGGGQAFDLVPNAALGVNLAATLNSIRQNVFPCTYSLPAPGLFDPTNPSLTYVYGAPGPIMTTTQTQVANLAACGATGGFYYDNNANPTQIILCPVLCATHQATLYSMIQLNIGCLDSCATTPVY
jgi:hypothetical protein